MTHEQQQGAKKTATDQGLQEQAEEIQGRFDPSSQEDRDMSEPEDWREAPKEGGGA